MLIVVSVVLLAGCTRGSEGGSLDERVQRFWELKQAKRWEEAYEHFLDPARKENLSKDAFLRRRLLAFDILSFTVQETNVNGDEATVLVSNEANIPLRGPGGKMQMIRKSVSTEDHWFRRDGVWYVDQRE